MTRSMTPTSKRLCKSTKCVNLSRSIHASYFNRTTSHGLTISSLSLAYISTKLHSIPSLFHSSPHTMSYMHSSCHRNSNIRVLLLQPEICLTRISSQVVASYQPAHHRFRLRIPSPSDHYQSPERRHSSSMY